MLVRTITFINVVLLMIISLGCKKFLKTNDHEEMLTAEDVFSNDTTAKQGMAGLYYKIMNTQSLLNGSISIYAGLSADELKSNTSKADDVQFCDNTLTAKNGALQTYLWGPGYYDIHFANACIEKLTQSTGVSNAIKRSYIGEAKFIRGLCYWYLVNLFGEVPLTLSYVINEKIALSRSPESYVYLQIFDDFKQASLLLPVDSPNTSPGKYAAVAMLARTSLYLKEWSNAEKYATGVIQAGRYALCDNIDQVFSSGSPEIIFQLPSYSPVYSTFEGFSFIPASNSTAPAFVLSNSLLNSFEYKDKRKSNWVKNIKVNGLTYSYPYKYKIRNGQSTLENNVILRLAEMYLIRAEARARSGDIPGAVDDLNILRNRAGLGSIGAGITFDQCLQAIEQERRLELFAEWGHRWFDLKRTNQIDGVLNLYKGVNWQSTDALYPIPNAEIDHNPNLIQNNGYD